MGYPTVDELVAGITGEAAAAIADLTDEQIEAMRQAAIVAIEDYTHQRFTDETTTITLDGSNANEIYLPRRLAELTTIVVDELELDTDVDVTLNDDRNRLSMAAVRGRGWLLQAQDDWRGRSGVGLNFGTGRDSVVITGNWGWTDDDWEGGLLNAVTVAIRTDMSEQSLADATRIAGTVTAYRKLGVKQFGQGAMQMTIDAATSLSTVNQVRLQDLVWEDLSGAVV